MFNKLKVLRSHGRPYIRDLDKVVLDASFTGRPEIKSVPDTDTVKTLTVLCPTGAILDEPFGIDIGKCVFCTECARLCPGNIVFTNDYRMAANVRDKLIVRAGQRDEDLFDPDAVRRQILRRFSRALKLREVSAGGDNSCEMELNASMNVNFDFGRYGIEFVASPRHADGVVVTGPLTGNMAEALMMTYCAVAEPKLLIVAGTDAISGGVFADSPALDRSFLEHNEPDLWLPGNPVHPMTFIHGIRTLLKYGR